MKHDLCVKMDDGILNIRVGAIIMKENRFLMVENDRFNHLYSVGGRIKFGETAEEAVRREVFEGNFSKTLGGIKNLRLS